MPPFYVVATVAFELEAPNAAAALEAVESGAAVLANERPYEPLAARAYRNKRAYENADKVPHSDARNWVKRGRRG